jgi:hypothetical protein
MLAEVLAIGPKQFQAFMEQRRMELPLFLKRALTG